MTDSELDARDTVNDLTDQLNEALAEVDRLKERQQQLLATIVRLTNEVPFPDEIKGWQEQRAKLIAEIGTLRAAVKTLAEDLGKYRELCQRMRPVYEAAVEWSESFGELSKRLPPHVHKLRAAVDAAAKEPLP